MAKATTTPKDVVTANNRPQRRAAPRRTITDTEIARRAYQLYLARGREDGHDVEDWLQAERELNGSIRTV
jgi:hypothetical protein